ncbi:hypothetical protein [Aeromonas caviae]|uniref:hypothetical protein n=1 Tax=Aeromonas caviae TaxID=648 RepID=UPI002441DB14|nr:hypothetical protein [Aeromonas caviae]
MATAGGQAGEPVLQVANAGGQAGEPVLQVANAGGQAGEPVLQVANAGGRAGDPVGRWPPGRGAGPGAPGRRRTRGPRWPPVGG